MRTPAELLPHKNPMIFISDVRAADIKEGTLTAHSKICQTDVLYQSDIGGVPSYVALEYMAQAIGCFVGLYDIENTPDKQPGIGFVLGTRKLKIQKPILLLDEDFLIDIKIVFFDENIASFDCVMYNEKTKEEVATALINAYRPDDIEAFMKEYT